jgi:hypothetical protein
MIVAQRFYNVGPMLSRRLSVQACSKKRIQSDLNVKTVVDSVERQFQTIGNA